MDGREDVPGPARSDVFDRISEVRYRRCSPAVGVSRLRTAVQNYRCVCCEAYTVVDLATTPEIRGRRGVAVRKRAASEWDRAPALFLWDILPRLVAVPSSEMMASAGCSNASASDYRPGGAHAACLDVESYRAVGFHQRRGRRSISSLLCCSPNCAVESWRGGRLPREKVLDHQLWRAR